VDIFFRRAYRQAPAKKFLLLGFIVALYAVILPYCYRTAGEPRKAAMIHAQQLADEKWALEGRPPAEDAELDEIDNVSIAFATPSVIPIEGGDYLSADAFDSNQIGVFGEPPVKASGGFLSGWFGPTKQQKQAQKEFEKFQKQFKELNVDGNIPLPPTYLPSAAACVALFLTVVFHALFHLLCHWTVHFKAMMLYERASKVDIGSFILVQPPSNRGKAALVKVTKSAATGLLHVEFQRQFYQYTPSAKLGEDSSKYPNGVFTLSTAPTDLPLEEYTSSRGLASDSEVDKAVERWGKNHLAVHIPGFLELLQLQLLSPLAMFQVFCALLWLLDEYWTYTMWTLASVLIFEATTVFQRTRTQSMLGGMAPKPTPIYVFRSGKWAIVTTKDLLPGDLISLAFKKRAANNSPGTVASAPPAPADGKAKDDEESNVGLTARDEVVPCDCLLLTGAAVVNEASLTGESIPQMKEAVNSDSDSSDTPLDMNGRHRVNVLFSGTSIVTINATPDAVSAQSTPDVQSTGMVSKTGKMQSNNIVSPPDGGAIAYVLRTGFSSSQGALLQMIEFSQQTVSGDSRETGMALLLLFIFALVAAGYVLNEGLKKKEKTTHEILLKCVIIITSVVPRQFPMQMAMAVNMALMALNKCGIFCTEQYRVPLAGKVSHCLFDKTGTLTTDQLVPVGIINPDYNPLTNATALIEEESSGHGLLAVNMASDDTALVLAACHSLVVVDEKPQTKDEAKVEGSNNGYVPTLVGDPIEVAAMKGVEWSWDADTSTASPGSWQTLVKGRDFARNKIRELQENLQKAQSATGTPPQQIQQLQKAIETLGRDAVSLETKISESKRRAESAPYCSVQVVQRHHFSSHLQRMSVVCKCVKNSPPSSSGNRSRAEGEDWVCLVKGSPEAVGALLIPSSKPVWYGSTYEQLARRGLRVLALACKRVPASANPREQNRAWVEADLVFAGFIAFECKIRADSGVVMKSLMESDHKVAMLTGDALLTSLHVAKQVSIVSKTKDTLTLSSNVKDGISTGDPYWVRRTPEGAESVAPFSIDTVEELGSKNDLLTTEAELLAVMEYSGGDSSRLWKYVGNFKVFARMSPGGKASIIRAIQKSSKDTFVLMCGDGGNDVGALKQADVGLALLAGHANANTTEDIEKSAEEKAKAGSAEVAPLAAEDALNAHENDMKKRGALLNNARMAHMKEFQVSVFLDHQDTLLTMTNSVLQARYQKEAQARMQEEVKKLTEKGELMAMWTVMKNQASQAKAAMDAENRRFMAMHGQIWDPKKDGDGLESSGMAGMMQSLENSDAGGLPVVRPGDASIAAPFTSRTPSVRAVVDLIRQGRCTLLSALMQQQIMMLESIIAAYTLSVLSLHNARSSERQMMASSWLIMTAAISFSYTTPIDKMHPMRPLKSLFHPAILISILGQAAIHIACMSLAVHWATEAMGPEKLQEVTEFFRKAKAKEIDPASLCAEDDYMCEMMAFWQAPFLPNLLNTVVFLVETSQMISVFFANYKGRPWMKGMMENHALFLSVFACIGGVVVASWEMIPQLNDMIQLAPFPDDAFRYKVVALVAATIAGTFLWDRLCTYLFARKVYSAMLEEALKTTWKDAVPIVMTVVKIGGGLLLLGTGNLLLIGAAIWMYRSYSQRQAQAALAK
jgi:cation-transporting ATPase 13A1